MKAKLRRKTCLRRLKGGGCGQVERRRLRIDLAVFMGNCFAGFGDVGNHQKLESENVTQLDTVVSKLLHDVILFAKDGSGLKLRSYQERVAEAIVQSVTEKLGLTFVVIFPRQSGKNELQAQIEAYLLSIFSQMEAEIVKVSPTRRPQSLNAMRDRKSVV